jgi:hypothetical protein
MVAAPPTSEIRPRGWSAIGIFLLFGAAMATLAGITLIFPGTVLDRAWVLNQRGHAGLLAAPRILGYAFPVLAAALLAAGIGWLNRHYWGWVLAATLISVNMLGDLFRFLSGAWLEGFVGFAIAGCLLFYMTRPRMRSMFR